MRKPSPAPRSSKHDRRGALQTSGEEEPQGHDSEGGVSLQYSASELARRLLYLSARYLATHASGSRDETNPAAEAFGSVAG